MPYEAESCYTSLSKKEGNVRKYFRHYYIVAGRSFLSGSLFSVKGTDQTVRQQDERSVHLFILLSQEELFFKK